MITGCLQLGALIVLVTVGVSFTLRHLSHESNGNNLIVAGMLASQCISGFFLTYPILRDYVSRGIVSSLSVQLCRAAGLNSGLSGLSIVIDGARRESSAYLFVLGTFVVLFSCLALMLSFWPSPHDQSPVNTENDETVRFLNADHSDPESLDFGVDYRLLEGTEDGLSQASTASIRNTTEARNDAVDANSLATNNSRIRGTRRLLQLATSEVVYLYAGCAVLLLRLPFSLSIPHFVSTTLSACAQADFHKARFEIVWLLVCGSIDAALDFWCVFLFGYANQRIVRGVRLDLFAKIIRQEVAFFDNTPSGELASRISNDCSEMAGDLTWFFRFSIESVVRITGITAYMMVRCPTLGCCALSIIPAVAVINKFYGDWLQMNARRVQDALAEANAVAQEAIGNIRTVIAFSAEDKESERYHAKIEKQYALNVQQLFMTGVYYMTVSTFLINTIVQGILLLIGSYLIEHNKLAADVLLAFMLYQGQLQNETMNLFQSYSSLVKSSGAGDKVFALLDRQPPAPAVNFFVSRGSVGSTTTTNTTEGQYPRNHNMSVSASSTTQRWSASELSAASDDNVPINDCANIGDGGGEGNGSTSQNSTEIEQYSVALKEVGFRYPTRPDQLVLDDFTLAIPPGKTIALVGCSGCGKSTVVSLLQRLYDPSFGRISVNGTDLRYLDIQRHRRRVGVVTQDPVLFRGTILENITYGVTGEIPAIEEVIRVARLANAHEFILDFPHGYLTTVGERGMQLSGGQKQRIAIARALMMRPSLLLLDEATSALDAQSEQAVQEALDRLLLGDNRHRITTLIVAHRLRTVRNADCIAFVRNGRVVEQGTHEELMGIRDGWYRQMVERAGPTGVLPES